MKSKQTVLKPKSQNRFTSLLVLGSISVLLIGCDAIGMLSPIPDTHVNAAAPTQVVNWAQALIAKPTYTPFPAPQDTPTSAPILANAPSTKAASPTDTSPSIAMNIVKDTAVPITIPPTTAPNPTKSAPPVPSAQRYILVSISQQHLYAYDNSQLVYSFIVSTGSGNSTRAGTFKILDKIPNAYGADWNFWMPDWMGIYWVGNLENGIHSLPLLPGGGRLWGDALGTPVSYGCVVLGIRDAATLFSWAQIGTTIQIRR